MESWGLHARKEHSRTAPEQSQFIRRGTEGGEDLTDLVFRSCFE